jgi:hypothetical protein
MRYQSHVNHSSTVVAAVATPAATAQRAPSGPRGVETPGSRQSRADYERESSARAGPARSWVPGLHPAGNGCPEPFTGDASRPDHRGPSMTFRRLCAASLLIGVAFLVGAVPASAHGGEANEPARDLVLTAVAALEAHPSGTSLVEDKINDALNSTEPGDVNLDLVRRARDTLAAGDLEQTTLLLEQAIGACPGAPVLYIPAGPREPAAAAPCPTPVYVRGVASRSLGGTAEPVLLVVAVLFAVAGGVVLRRVH